MTQEAIWYYLGSDDVPRGPVARDDLLELVRFGHAREDAMVWRDGLATWRPFKDVAELAEPRTQAGDAPASPQPSKTRTLAPSRAVAVKPSVAPKLPDSANPSDTAKRLKAPAPERGPWVLGGAFGVAAVALLGALYVYSSPQRSDAGEELAAPSAEPLQEIVESQPAAPLPVRVQNPFDASEVFEFPPGTDERDARDAVADLLLERAMQRQKKKAS